MGVGGPAHYWMGVTFHLVVVLILLVHLGLQGVLANLGERAEVVTLEELYLVVQVDHFEGL